MLSLVTGKQRSGKSYCVVSMMIDYLRSCGRHIYTNLPINPDSLCDVACGGRLRNPVSYSAYMSRLHLFVDYSGRSRVNLRFFKAKNPDFVKLYHSTFTRGRLSQNLLLPCGAENSIIRQFWRYTQSNSVIFFDEVYEIFGAIDQLKNSHQTRKELLSYAKQHGHFKDDLFLITHDPADIDKLIRKSINKQYVIENSKYKNIFEHRLFKGLRWPVQFFIVKGYEYGERVAQDQYNVFPKQAVFACYNSFNVSSCLNKEQAAIGACSSDTRIDQRANVSRFFHQAFPLLLLITSAAIGFFCLIYFGYRYFARQTASTSTASRSSSASASPTSEATPSSSSIVLVTPTSVVFSNGDKILLGGLYRGYEVKKISRDSVVLSVGDRLVSVPLSAWRASSAIPKSSGNKAAATGGTTFAASSGKISNARMSASTKITSAGTTSSAQ